ncbi:phytochrome-like protein [Mycena filopes]|nr:phytochrome-like protein [Mycena filopes]
MTSKDSVPNPRRTLSAVPGNQRNPPPLARLSSRPLLADVVPPALPQSPSKEAPLSSDIVQRSASGRSVGTSEPASGCELNDASDSDGSDSRHRLQHVENEDGHHIIVGREGKLTCCEDEPIRTPGAVQAFGVLIVVDEVDDALVVRQVSENAEEILGLSPRYLFSLNCFTDTLSKSQASVLWNNIHFLSESEKSGDDEVSPHMFSLTGLGAPQSPPLDDSNRRSWTCWCAMHRPSNATVGNRSRLIIMEFELERDSLNPLYPLADPTSSRSISPETAANSATHQRQHTESDALEEGHEEPSAPSAEDILESTTSRAKPLPALERLRRLARMDLVATSGTGVARGRRARRAGSGGVGLMDVFAVMAQLDEQLGDAPDLPTFLQVLVGLIKDLSQFHRVLVYQFDEAWNGQVVTELLDWSKTQDLYRGLHFPATDIPAQARQLYAINKVRLLYDRSQNTARIVVRSAEDLETPLNMTHCYLRAVSPNHIKYLENMGVRASMSVSIMAFGALWGLVSCHSYGEQGMRVSFPVREIMRLLSQSISRNVERLSYAQRLMTMKLRSIQINIMASQYHPVGSIISDADDLVKLFDADFGVLVVGGAAKLLGPSDHENRILAIAEYLRLKQYTTIQVSQAINKDFEELADLAGSGVLAGMLYVPLSTEGKDFICVFRKEQLQHVHWAGNPKLKARPDAVLEPRKSFAVWSETVAGRCRLWTNEQIETAGVLALVYSKFIEVWRQKERAVEATRLTNLLLSNASEEGESETTLPSPFLMLWAHYLEMALSEPLDHETRDNLTHSHAASKGLLFTINDLLDLSRLERGNETSNNEPFNLRDLIVDATHLYRKEAKRRNIAFNLELENSPRTVVGDAKKIRTVVQNLTDNAVKYTSEGTITVGYSTVPEPHGLRGPNQTVVEIVVADTGCGIDAKSLGSMFREFEELETMEPKILSLRDAGLGLAVVVRIVKQLRGQLRVDSKVAKGSRFSFLIPLALLGDGNESAMVPLPSTSHLPRMRVRRRSLNSTAEIQYLVEAQGTNPIASQLPFRSGGRRARSFSPRGYRTSPILPGVFLAPDPLYTIKIDGPKINTPTLAIESSPSEAVLEASGQSTPASVPLPQHPVKLRLLIVEDNAINRAILAKRLRLDGHTVITTMNGQEGLDKVASDRAFDAVFMDIQMPILDGYEATKRIRVLEKSHPSSERLSSRLNGGHIPIFAVSASLVERRREEMVNYGIDGWILKPIDFKRLKLILSGVTDPEQRQHEKYHLGCSWEAGGWFFDAVSA